MPNSLRSLVVSSRNAILRRKPKPLHDDANFSNSLTGTTDHNVDKNPSITHGQPPPLSTIASYGPVNNGELSSSTYAHPNFEVNDTTSRGSDKKSDAQVGSAVDNVVTRVRLPDYLQREPSLASIAQIAYERRARRAAVKENAERRVHLCEEQLKFFRQELSNAERELQEVESNVQGWQKFFSQFEPIVEDVAGGTGHAIVRNIYVDTDPSAADFLATGHGFRDTIDVGSGSLNINFSGCSSPASNSDFDISDH